MRRATQAGFTLLEVLVAVAILGLGLASILSVQFSAVTGAGHARHMGVAMGLARCKMAEVEEQLTRDGFPEIILEESGACCEGDNTYNISCSWTVERPTFPDPQYGKLNLDTDLDTSPLGTLASAASDGENLTNGDIGDLASSLSGGDVGELAAGGVGGIASMVMEMVYPDLKALFESSARKVTIVLTWTEGDRQYDIEVVQWVVQPQAGLVPDTDEVEDAIEGESTPDPAPQPKSKSKGLRP